jgi:hypothetical protein
MRREIPMMITTIVGTIIIVVFFVPLLEELRHLFFSWFQVIAGFALVLGGASLLIVNLRKISRQVPGWGYSVVLIAGLFTMAFLGITQGLDSQAFRWRFINVYTPLSATMFSLLAFYIASAAFRAFKAKTMEAGLLLITAFLVMLGRVPLGEQLWSAMHLNNIIPISTLVEEWIMGTFNTAGQRAIILGSSIGVISVSMKILLGVERSYLGGGE